MTAMTEIGKAGRDCKSLIATYPVENLAKTTAERSVIAAETMTESGAMLAVHEVVVVIGAELAVGKSSNVKSRYDDKTDKVVQ